MPNQSANATNLRTPGYKPRLYLSVLDGSILATCSVDSTPDDGAIALAVTVLTGTLDNAYRGMRIVIRNPSGEYKGTVSIGYRSAVIPTSIPIRELSSGEVPIVAGDILTVYDDLVLTDILPAADLSFAPDSEAYSDQNDMYDPFVNSGGHNVGWLTGGFFSSPYLGSASFLVDPDSSTPITHQWVGTGSPTFTVGSSTSADPTLRWSAAGNYRVEHLVTDPDSGQTALQFARVRVHDANDPPFSIVLSQAPNGKPETGFSFSFTLFDNPSLADLRDNAHVVLWSDDTIAGGVPFGSKLPGRSHIVAEGYVRRDDGELGDGVNAVTFEVISPLARLAELPGFSKVFIRDQTPAAWSEYKSLTVKQAIIALLRVYTNISQIFDLIFDGFDDADYPLLYITKQNPYEQVQAECRGRLARLTCDRTGRLEVQGQLWAVPLASRAAFLKTFTFTGADIIPGSRLRRDHVRPIETFHLRGFVEGIAITTEDGTTDPVFAKYPATPARGGQVIIEERAIVNDTPNDVYVRCSLWAAWTNADYYNADNVWQHAPELTVSMPLVYARMLQFYREFCAFSITGVDQQGRQIDLADFDWILTSVNEDYGNLTAQAVFRAATYAPPEMSVDDTPASEGTLPPENQPPVVLPPIVQPIVDPNGLKRGIANLGLFTSGNRLLHIVNGNRAGAAGGVTTVRNIDLTALSGWGGGTLLEFQLDPFCPFALGTGAAVNGVLLTTTHAQKITNVQSATPTLGTAKSFGSTAVAANLYTSRWVKNWVVAVRYRNGAGVSAHYSLDGGGTWTDASTSGLTNYDTNASHNPAPGLIPVPGVGLMYFTIFTATTTGSGMTTAARSINASGTIATLSSPVIAPDEWLAGAISTCATRDGSVMYHGITDFDVSPEVAKLGRNGVDISPVYSAETYGNQTIGQPRAITVSDADPNIVMLVGTNTYNNSVAPEAHGLWVTTAANQITGSGSSLWTNLQVPTVTTTWTGSYSVGSDFLMIGKNGYGIGFWDHNMPSVAPDNRNGDLGTVEVVSLCGIG